nr:hypothetical protein GCM10017745_54230 [Saccharothrix mutabilis subsp. capreolus]
MRFAEAAEQDAQHGVGVGGGADGGAGVGAHAFLVDHDGGAEVAQGVDVGAADGGHEGLDERGVGLVDQALRLGGDGAEDERGLAGAGDAGEDGEAAFGDVDADVLEVVLAGTSDLDDVVAVGGGSHALLPPGFFMP